MPPSTVRVGITMGDPCGVGPEIIAKALASAQFPAGCAPVVIGDPVALERAIQIVGANLKVEVHHASENTAAVEEPAKGGYLDAQYRQDTVAVIAPVELLPKDTVPARPTSASCHAVIRYIETAVAMALGGSIEAICTCPIHKAHLHRHGFPFPGHTEFLRSLTRADRVVMMLAGPNLRVSLVTIHHALAEVSGLLDRELLAGTIRITAEALLNDFALAAPRIAVAGLNPHAGEEGQFGLEERDLIEPVVKSFKGGPCAISGPFPPDTLFYRAYQGEFDAVVAMYHDQGLIPIKLVHFHEAVNVSLGLPLIRTSVDHGTAYDLAGTGKAHPGSLLAAIEMAATMARNRKWTRSSSMVRGSTI